MLLGIFMTHFSLELADLEVLRLYVFDSACADFYILEFLGCRSSGEDLCFSWLVVLRFLLEVEVAVVCSLVIRFQILF